MLPFSPARFGNPAALAGARWSPLAFSPLGWWDAQQQSLGNGDALTSISDGSGNNRPLTEATNPGAFSTTGLNGHPEFQFDGVNDKASRADNCGWTNNAFTMWCVGRLRGSTSARSPLFTLDGAHFIGIEANTFSTAGSKWGLSQHAHTFDLTAATSTAPVIYIWRVSAATVGSSNIISVSNISINGSAQTLTRRFTGTGDDLWSASAASLTFTRMGNFATVFGNVGVGEAGFCQSDIGAAGEAQLYAYLAAKWA